MSSTSKENLADATDGGMGGVSGQHPGGVNGGVQLVVDNTGTAGVAPPSSSTATTRTLSSAGSSTGGGSSSKAARSAASGGAYHLPHPSSLISRQSGGSAAATAAAASVSDSRVAVLVSALIALWLLHDYLKECHFRQEGFAFSRFLQFVSQLVSTVAAAVLLWRKRRRETMAVTVDDPAGKIQLTRPLLSNGARTGFASSADLGVTMTQYAAIAALLSLSAAMTAASSDFANEPAKVLFKQSRLMPTLAIGALMGLAPYRWTDYLTSAVFVAGLLVFASAGFRGQAPTVGGWMGLSLLGGALAGEGAVPCLQHRLLRRPSGGRPLTELLCAVSFFSAAINAAALAFSGELRAAVGWYAHRPSLAAASLLLLLHAATAFLALALYLKLLLVAGSKVAVMAGSCRRVAATCVSIVLLTTPISGRHSWGLLIVGAGLLANGWCVRGSSKAGGGGGRAGSGRIIDIGAMVVPGLQLHQQVSKMAGSLRSHLQLPVVLRSPERRR